MLSRVSRLADPLSRVNSIENSRESRLISEVPLDKHPMPSHKHRVTVPEYFYTLVAKRKLTVRHFDRFF